MRYQKRKILAVICAAVWALGISPVYAGSIGGGGGGTPSGAAGGVLGGTYPNPGFSSTTGSGAVVLATSPTLTTPTIAAITNLTSNGYVTTTNSDGTLAIVTPTIPTIVSGTATISNSETNVTIVFSQPDTNYIFVATPTGFTGVPILGSNRVYVVQKFETGVILTPETAPGEGNSITFDWILTR